MAKPFGPSQTANFNDGTEVVMTLNMSVTDDQLGRYTRRVAAIAERLEKSLSYEKVMDALQRIHDGEFDGQAAQVSAPAPEHALNFIIRVDRAVRPAYPDWVKTVIHHQLECTGPAEYDLSSDVEQWLHEGQKTGRVTGQVIYSHLKANNLLEGCLGLADLLAIQAKGIAVFRKLFAGNVVFGWKSVVRNRFGHLRVPCLCESDDGVFLRWYWLGDDWYSNDPALRFRK